MLVFSDDEMALVAKNKARWNAVEDPISDSDAESDSGMDSDSTEGYDGSQEL